MKKIIIFLQVILITIVFVSCDDYLDVNTDPHNPEQVNPELVLPVALAYTAFGLQDWSNGQKMSNSFGNMMMYNWSQSDGFSWYYDEFQYLVTPNFYDQLWDNIYQNTLKQYNVLESYEGAEYDNYKAISKIMKSYHYQMLVDTYGDIPYSEALQRGGNQFPRYDDAQEVYDELIVSLNTAIALINNATVDTRVPGADDIAFHGNMDTWKKLANTIKMRILVRMSGITSKQGYINDEFANIAAEGSGFIDADANINPGYFTETNKQNPFWDSYGKNANGDITNDYEATCASDFIISYLQNSNDPRLDYLFSLPATGHLGVPQGLTEYPTGTPFGPYDKSFVSHIGPGLLKGPNQDAPFFTLSEALFLQSEAAERGYTSGDAKALYESAIDASFTYLGASGSSSIYGLGADGNWDASTDKIESIITQKWLALIGINAFESWVEYNRTGFPSNLPISQLASTSDRPVRLAYPASELSSNRANVPSQPNVFNDKIFWAN